MRSAPIVLAVLAALSVFSGAGQAEVAMQRFTMDGGGGTSSGGTYALSGTIGQPDAGALSGGTYALAGGFWFGGSATSGIEQDPSPGNGAWITGISPAAPNPMRGQSVLAFRLARPEVVHLEIYNIGGELVRNLLREPRPAGSYRLVWDGKDDRGSEVASGFYFVRFVTSEHEDTQKLLLVR
ncbi:MAG: FlgD immunoglobulin-like domain containing protein [Candidatus Eisenbacteria bacterium]